MSEMTRTAGRELALHMVYELSYSDLSAEALLEERLSEESFASLAQEDPLYEAFSLQSPQLPYIRRLVTGVYEHAPELDSYISRYAVGWQFSRISRIVAAILRLSMYELLYMPDIPNGAAINEAVELTKRYETPEAAAFVNGILGSFARQECAEPAPKPEEAPQ